MEIAVRLAFDELAAVRLLNWLASENALLLSAHPELPQLYESGVVYQREQTEVWSDYVHLLQQGHEDCDALSAARAGELMARGWRVLGPEDGGYAEARRRRLARIPAEVFLRTRVQPGSSGVYHCVVRYRVGRHIYRDDPSVRLGMLGGELRPNPFGARAFGTARPLGAARRRRRAA